MRRQICCRPCRSTSTAKGMPERVAVQGTPRSPSCPSADGLRCGRPGVPCRARRTKRSCQSRSPPKRDRRDVWTEPGQRVRSSSAAMATILCRGRWSVLERTKALRTAALGAAGPEVRKGPCLKPQARRFSRRRTPALGKFHRRTWRLPPGRHVVVKRHPTLETELSLVCGGHAAAPADPAYEVVPARRVRAMSKTIAESRGRASAEPPNQVST
mmetsp:Transcript_24652/g.68751  ORF Transcript_24652/g.68751 Transcript_24652/m.68751 type:complete len:214 (+) Transcript_24652:343-984(+)